MCILFHSGAHKMAVNIKRDIIKSEPMGRSPPELNVNAMDDDKEKSYAFQQTLMKKEHKTNADEVSTSIQNVSRKFLLKFSVGKLQEADIFF